MTDSTRTPGTNPDIEQSLRTAFMKQVELIPDGSKIKQCIQCGTCTGSCPVSDVMDISPRKVIALFRAGDIKSVLQSNTIWLCASCYACTVRCPAGIRITDLMYAFKRLAMERRLYPRHLNMHALSRAFLAIVNKRGRNHEFMLLLRYGLRTNPLKLISSIPLGWRLRWKGRMPLWTRGIRDTRQLAGIISFVEHRSEPPRKSVPV